MCCNKQISMLNHDTDLHGIPYGVPQSGQAMGLEWDTQNAQGNKDKTTRRGPSRRAFSLIEIMVVVVIIGILAGAVAVGMGQYVENARINRAKSDLATIVMAIENYKIGPGNGRYPTQEQGLSVIDFEQGTGTDPWGRPYGYLIPGQNDEPYEVYTLGRDGRDGGEGVDADIYSWQIGDAEEAQ